VTDDDVLAHVRAALPEFTASGTPVRLPEGNLNHVWRVPGATRSVIVKHAPPHVAADPDIPLDPARLGFETRALQDLSPGGALADVASHAVRPPRLVHADLDAHILVMEDIGEVPTLHRWLRTADAAALRRRASDVGKGLGAFVGRLHRQTSGRDRCAARFHNAPVQETRYAVQYQAVADLLRRADVADADALGSRAEALGEKLLSPGRCLVMGDLWPPSVLVTPGALRVIDWEFAHYGQPAQDIAHLAAHLWMQAHRAPSDAAADAVHALADAFSDHYRDALGSARKRLLTDTTRADGAVHFGAEILVRTVGRFQSGYVYDGLAPENDSVQEAVSVAARRLRDPSAGLGMWNWAD
jgi:5-methylthioribose kinase